MKIKPISFTVSFNGKAKALITSINIYNTGDKNHNFKSVKDSYNALWDTGSNMTVISNALAEALNLNPVGEMLVDSVNGKFRTKKYVISITLPNKLNIENLVVSSGNLGPGIDLLIGLDLITLGDFSITNVNNRTVFSFRFPSTKVIDYVIEK